MQEPSEPREKSLDESDGEGDGGGELDGDGESEGEPPRYGGPLDSDWGGRSTNERERTRREYERRMDRQWDQQRRFQVDKSGNRYRRK